MDDFAAELEDARILEIRSVLRPRARGRVDRVACRSPRREALTIQDYAFLLREPGVP
jgi:hypothetical protein